MKKQILIFVFLMATFVRGVAQEGSIDLDTIYANDRMNVAMIFPEPIRQGITGSDNFVFTYNREKEQPLGLLQAIPGEDSNLLVVSINGSIFSYIVKYSEKLKRLNYFIADSAEVGSEFPSNSGKLKDDVAVFSDSKAEKELGKKVSFYKEFSSHLLKSKQRIGNLKKRRYGVELKVENIVFHNSELFFVLEINNNSPIDYEPAFLNISVETRKQGRKKSIQKLPITPLYKFKVPEIIPQGKSSRFVYVLPKFSIAEDKIVVVDLKEQQGERDIKLKIKKRFINNPN